MQTQGVLDTNREQSPTRLPHQLRDPCVVVPVGPSGAGKSTFLEAHFPSTQIVNSDTCRLYVSDDVQDQTCNKQAFELFYTWIEARLQLGRRTVADATNLRGFARRRLREISAKCEVPVVLLLFPTSPELCVERNLMRDRHVPEHVIHKHVDQYEDAESAVLDEEYHAIVTVHADWRCHVLEDGAYIPLATV